MELYNALFCTFKNNSVLYHGNFSCQYIYMYVYVCVSDAQIHKKETNGCKNNSVNCFISSFNLVFMN